MTNEMWAAPASATINPAAIAAVLIDLDGTLLDTVADLAAAASRVRADHGLPALPVARIGEFVGKGADVLMHRCLTDDPDGRLDAPALAAARAGFDRHYAVENGRSARPYAGVIKGLARLKARGLRMACVTNKPQAFADALLQAQGMASSFELVLGGDALAQKKPHPMPLLYAANHFRVTPGQCAMIGDSLNDARAARAAGMLAMLVPYGYNEGLDIATIDCDVRIDSLLDAARFLSA